MTTLFSKVSIICLCYNHGNYVEEAIKSIVNQTYQNIEIILVDDCSEDKSREVIARLTLLFPQIKYISNKVNLGNCKSFNKGFALSTGEFIIDHAADDVLLPDRISQQVEMFQSLDESYWAIYSNAQYVNAEGKHLAHHFHAGSPSWKLPYSGNVYAKVIQNYFIPSQTVMFRRSALEKMGGYDETLAYEDFDIMVRISREYKIGYLDNCTTMVRRLNTSMSSQQYKFNGLHPKTTLKVCKKILWLNTIEINPKALRKRIYYEFKKCLVSLNFKATFKYLKLLRSSACYSNRNICDKI